MDEKDAILVVDDDPKIREVLCETLRTEGYEPVGVASGEAALKTVDGVRPAVALIDLKLGDISGLEVMKEIKELAPSTECIVITGYATRASAIEAVNIGAYSYLQKPYGIGQLLQVVRNAIEKREADQELQRLKEFNGGIVQTMRDGIVIQDAEGLITFVNPAAAILLGYSPTELMGQHWMTIVPPDQHTIVQRAYERRERGEADRYELELVRKDGEHMHVLVSGTPRFDGDRFVSSLAVFTDITERKRTERLLETLNTASLAMESALTHDEIFIAMAEELKKLGFSCALFPLDESRNRLLIKYLSYKSKALRAAEELVSIKHKDFSIPIGIVEPYRKVIHERKTVFVEKAEEGVRKILPEGGERFARQIVRLLNVSKSIAAPLIVEDEVVGMLSVQSDDLNEDDAPAITAFANQMAACWRKAQLYEQSQAHRSHLETLQRINATLRSTLPLDQVLEIIAESTSKAFRCVGSFIMVPDATGERLTMGTMWGSKLKDTICTATNFSVDEFTIRVSSEDNPVVRAFLTGEIQIARTVLDQSTMGVEPANDLEQFIAIAHTIMSKMAVFVPLLAGDEAVGVLVAIFPRDMLSEEEQGMLLSLADQAGLAIENARLFEQVRSGRERLRTLAQRVLTAQEGERRHLSHELHDESGQALTALKITLEMIKDDLPDDAHNLRQRVDEAVALADTTTEGIRLLSHSLRPPALDALGLTPTLEIYCQEFTNRTQLTIDYADTELPTLPDEVNITFYRLLQEALTNVAKHAQADRVWATLDYDGEAVSLTVEDNGRGFKLGASYSGGVESIGIGILGMRERLQMLDGTLEISSKPGKGTKLVMRVPVNDTYNERR